MNWLPRTQLFEAWSCDPLRPGEPSTTGACLVISWLGFVIEIGLHRHDR